MQQHRFYAMGCHMLAVVDADGETASGLLGATAVWFEECEQQLSRFRADSALSQLNRVGRLSHMSPILWAALRAAIQAAQLTDGLVSPALLDALEAAGYNRSFEALNTDQPPASRAGMPADWHRLRVDARDHSATLPPGVRLDLGGVAKGWAAGEALRRLAAAGPALVDAGGDIVVSGPMADGSAWPIAIDDPRAPEGKLGVLLLDHGAVATSGRDYRRWRQGGQERHHIIDPRTGQPAQTDVLTATVVAPDGVTAEAAAKAALILGSAGGCAWIDAHPALAAMLVLDDGRILESGRIGAYLERPAILEQRR